MKFFSVFRLLGPLVLQLLHPHCILTHPTPDIEDEEVIKKILKHLGLSASFLYPDPDYPMDSQRISKPDGVTPLVAIYAMNVAFLNLQKAIFEDHTFRFLNSIAGEGSGKICPHL